MNSGIVIKVLFLGESTVGKTSILQRFIDDKFSTNVVTTLGPRVDFKTKKIQIGDQELSMQLWDTAGQERFHTITNTYYHNVQGIIVVYDITQMKSLDCVSNWIQNIRDKASEDVVVFLVGNKSDLEAKRQVKFQQGQQTAESAGLKHFYECSAKNSYNIQNIFNDMLQQIIQKKFANTISGSYRIRSIDNARPKSCCD